MLEYSGAVLLASSLYIWLGAAAIAVVLAAVIILLTLKAKKNGAEKVEETKEGHKETAADEKLNSAPKKEEITEEVHAKEQKPLEAEAPEEKTEQKPEKENAPKTAKEEAAAVESTEVLPESNSQAEEKKALKAGCSVVKDEAEEQESVICEKPAYAGKFEINLRNDGYHFSLIANNGQLLYDSYGFTSAQGAVNGIENFKKAVEEGTFTVYKDKFDRYRFVLNKRYAGENYTNKLSCENSVKSVKRFAKTATIIPYIYDEEAEKLYEQSRADLKTVSDEEWDKISAEPVKVSGKYEIVSEDDGFHFYLVANNGQLLYSSRSYTTEAGAIEGINTFKRAVYTGNFYVDEDKFGKFRYILRGAGGSIIYTGESFSTKKSALSNVESVKNFALTAQIKTEEPTKE